MKIDDTFSIQVEGTCVTLYRSQLVNKGKHAGETRAVALSYHATVAQALVGYLHQAAGDAAPDVPTYIKQISELTDKVAAFCDGIKRGDVERLQGGIESDE